MTPGRGCLTEVWLLASSLFSAQLAGQLGLPFSFACHFAPNLLDQALAAYRSDFRPSILHDAPHVMVAVSVLCADSDEEARRLSGASALNILQLRTGRFGLLPSPEDAAAYPFTPAETALVEDACRRISSKTPPPFTAAWSRCRSGQGPPRSCSRPEPTPTRRGSGR